MKPIKTELRTGILQLALVFCGTALLDAEILTNGEFEKGTQGWGLSIPGNRLGGRSTAWPKVSPSARCRGLCRRKTWGCETKRFAIDS
jgi:hypothetical protein